MLISDSEVVTSQGIAELLASALAPIGDISLEPRLQGVALLDDGVMFGYVDATGTPYLRATAMSAPRFHALDSTKHPEMQYWSIPHSLAADIPRLRELAFDAADAAHLAFSFDIDEVTPLRLPGPMPLHSLVCLALLAV